MYHESPVKPARGHVEPLRAPVDARGLWDSLSLAIPFWDAGSPRFLEDVSGNGLHATLGAGFVAGDWGATPWGPSLHFGGISNEIGTVADPGSDLLDGASTLSFEAWVRFGDVDRRCHVLGKYRPASGKRSWLLSRESTNKLRFTVSDDGEAFEYVETTATYAADTWYHIVGTFDAGTYAIHVDGSAVATTGSVSATSIFAGSEVLSIGYRISSGGAPENIFVGDFLSARVWKRVLTSTEVRELALRPWRQYAQDWPFPVAAVEHSGAAAAGPWIYWGEVDEGVESEVVTGLANGVGYDFQIFTLDDSGNVSSGSSALSATPAAAPETPPEIYKAPLQAAPQVPAGMRPYRR